jgi:hypothetical protein
VLSDQHTLRAFLADVASVRRVYRGPISYGALSFERVGFVACRDAGNPEFLGTLNATWLSLLGWQILVVRRFSRPRVATVYPRDEQAQAGLLIDQLQLLDQAGVDGAFVMSFSFPLALYSEDPRYDLDATAQHRPPAPARLARHDLSRRGLGTQRGIPRHRYTSRLLPPCTAFRAWFTPFCDRQRE